MTNTALEAFNRLIVNRSQDHPTDVATVRRALSGEQHSLVSAQQDSLGSSQGEPVGCCARCGVVCQFCGAPEGTVARRAGDEMAALRAKLAARSSEPGDDTSPAGYWQRVVPEGDGRT